MQNIFNVTSIFGDYSNKEIVIETNFAVDKATVTKKTVKVVTAESGTIVIYKLSTNENKIIITLKEWPNLNTYYQINVTDIKDMLGRELVSPITKNIEFTADTKLKAVIMSPDNNEAVLRQHNLIYFSVKQINADGTITTCPKPELADYRKEDSSNNKTAILASESDIKYEVQFATDIAFFNVIKTYSSEYTDGLTDLDNGQYYMRARIIEKGLSGDWSEIITFTAVNEPSACDDIKLTESQKEYLEDIFAPVDFFLDQDKSLEIVSRSSNGITHGQFYIEFNLDIDKDKLPKQIIAYRSDL